MNSEGVVLEDITINYSNLFHKDKICYNFVLLYNI